MVLCKVTSGHEKYLARIATGTIVREVSCEDEETARKRDQASQRIFEEARRLAMELSLPLEILDVDLPFEGNQAQVFFLAPNGIDYRPLVSNLSRRHDLAIVMHNLAEPKVTDPNHGSCGKPDCGQGHCNSCGSGGGCSTCGSGTKKEEIAAFLASPTPPLTPSLRTSLI
jgi:hypothetical protein